MKRITAILLLISIMISLISCKGKGGSPSTNNVPNTPSSTILNVATDLANELDNMPLYGDVISSVSMSTSSAAGRDTRSKTSRVASASARGSYVGARSSFEESNGDGTYYHEDYLKDDSEQHFVKHISSDYSESKYIVQELKKTKNNALLNCKMLDVWVNRKSDYMLPGSSLRPVEENYSYRINYNLKDDAVTIEEYHVEYGDTYSYTKITVAYVRDGKLMINGYISTFNDTNIKNIKSVHYLEDEYYMSVTKKSDNLTDENAEIVHFFNYETEEWAELQLNFDIMTDTNGNQTVVYNGVDYKFSYIEDGYLVENHGKDGMIVMPDRRELGTWSDSGAEYTFAFDMFDGWVSIESKENSERYVLTTPSASYEYYDLTASPDPEITSFGFCDIRFSYFCSYTTFPYITIDTYDPEGERVSFWTANEIRENVKKIAERFGLTVRENELEQYLSQYSAAGERAASFEFLNGIKGGKLDSAKYNELKDMVQYEEVNIDALLAAKNADRMEYEDQNPEYEYFELLKFNLSGQAQINTENATIDLSKISATLSPSVLLNEGAEYKLVFCMSAGKSFSYIGAYSTEFDGKAMTFSGSLTFERESFPINYGEYVLICYIADENDNRISRSITLSGSNVTLDLSNDYRGTTLTSTEEKVSIYNYLLDDSKAE